MNAGSAIEQIARIVGARGLVRGVDAEPYLRDERGLYRGEAAAVVRPASTAECARVVRLCQEAGVGVVPQGGNTGYCGGATPFDGRSQIVLSLSRMNRVRAVDPVNFAMTVEAGVVLAEAHAAAERCELMFPLSMGSEGACQIGGVLSTNAGGVAVLRYGNARDLVLGLEVVLPNGETLADLKGLRKGQHGLRSERTFPGRRGHPGGHHCSGSEAVPGAAQPPDGTARRRDPAGGV